MGLDGIQPPIDLGKIAQHYGITLKKAKFSDDDALGQLDRKTKTIYVREDLSFPRMAFTIAHELGHFILHDKLDRTTFWRTTELNLEKQTEQEEQEANCFAASILMPRSEIIKWWSKTNDISFMASVFGVSNSAMAWRLKNLGVIEYS